MKYVRFFIVTLVVLALGSSLCMAGNPFNIPRKPIPRFPSTDVGIIAGASNCPCPGEIEQSGAMYFKDIMAYVSIPSGASLGVTLTAKYYDLIKGKMVTKTKHVNLRHNDYVTIATGYLLIKKSPGLTVEIKPDAPFIDKNPSNNKVTLKMCQRCYIVE